MCYFCPHSLATVTIQPSSLELFPLWNGYSVQELHSTRFQVFNCLLNYSLPLSVLKTWIFLLVWVSTYAQKSSTSWLPGLAYLLLLKLFYFNHLASLQCSPFSIPYMGSFETIISCCGSVFCNFGQYAIHYVVLSTKPSYILWCFCIFLSTWTLIFIMLFLLAQRAQWSLIALFCCKNWATIIWYAVLPPLVLK